MPEAVAVDTDAGADAGAGVGPFFRRFGLAAVAVLPFLGDSSEMLPLLFSLVPLPAFEFGPAAMVSSRRCLLGNNCMAQNGLLALVAIVVCSGSESGSPINALLLCYTTCSRDEEQDSSINTFVQRRLGSRRLVAVVSIFLLPFQNFCFSFRRSRWAVSQSAVEKAIPTIAVALWVEFKKGLG